MSLVRLIYVSRMTEACDTAAIQDILKVSRRNNPARDITGMLCYDPKYFMQCLEGPNNAVNDLYRDIARDIRHTQVTLLDYQEIEERAFGQWSMAFLRGDDLDTGLLRKFGGRGKFDPFMLSPGQARELVIDIVNQKREQLKDQIESRDR
ncbi:MAG TPA: BLUF domain-containing protein [Candidatus Hydrogenedentes bacterium]|nr:BLUF domain-containing protein [Candidatus Hydrogenedentota bacterium]